ncbi:MAG: class I SAM-dependent methyltransferase [Lentisphaeraceae bacterium]|nr:class I SAM-dependent methyltransferase [Lentisphaeraceae bacterium]
MIDPKISSAVEKTLMHYQLNAESFWEGTKDHDVAQNYAALQTNMTALTGMTVLDFGCGPGRDLIHFTKRGHTAIGLDGCEAFCEMARANSNCEVWHQDFCELDLPENFFDGVFANASIFHIPKSHLPIALEQLNGSLKSGGVLFSSNPRGSCENFDGARYGNYMQFEEYETFLNNAGFEVIDHYYRPTGWPRAEQPWLAVVSRKIGLV